MASSRRDQRPGGSRCTRALRRPPQAGTCGRSRCEGRRSRPAGADRRSSRGRGGTRCAARRRGRRAKSVVMRAQSPRLDVRAGAGRQATKLTSVPRQASAPMLSIRFWPPTESRITSAPRPSVNSRVRSTKLSRANDAATQGSRGLAAIKATSRTRCPTDLIRQGACDRPSPGVCQPTRGLVPAIMLRCKSPPPPGPTVHRSPVLAWNATSPVS